jgi:hypothetical protein
LLIFAQFAIGYKDIFISLSNGRQGGGFPSGGGMMPPSVLPLYALVIARNGSDEAIQSGASDWITSRHFAALAMTT